VCCANSFFLIGVFVSANSDETREILLIIEDNDDNRTTLAKFLESLGYNAVTAANGIEGVRKGLEYEPRLAIVDIGLPGIDGFEVARRLRAVFQRDIFLIAQSGNDAQGSRQQAMAAGFDEYFPKPVDLTALRARLTNLN
jgi:two-component system, sensor histidine kinase